MQTPNTESTKMLASFVEETTFEDLPDEVVTQTKNIILDTIGCALCGSATRQGIITADLIEELGGKTESTVFGNTFKTSCASAAFVNAKMSNALDFDDAFANRTHFAGLSVFPPLAIGEKMNTAGREYLTAVALGYDISARFAISIGPWDRFIFDEQDDEPKSEIISHALQQVYSIFAGVTATSKVLGFDKKRIESALGIAGSVAPMCNIKFEPPDFFYMTKYQEFGFIAYSAVISSLLAKKGYTSPKNVFDDPNGFYHKLGLKSGSFSYDHFTSKLGEKWWIMESQIKHYPACRWNNGPANCMEKIVENNNLKPEEIKEVVVRSFPLLLRPAWRNKNPQMSSGAQFSIPHTIAMIAFKIDPGSDWYAPKILDNPKVSEFRKKVTVKYNPEFRRAYDEYINNEALREIYNGHGYMKIPHEVEVSAIGKKFLQKAEYTPGDPWTLETRTTDEKIKDKFRKNAYHISSSKLWRERIEEIITKVYSLEKIKNVREITNLFIF